MSLFTVSALYVNVGGFLLFHLCPWSLAQYMAYKIHAYGNLSMQRAVCEDQKIMVTSMVVKTTLFPVYGYQYKPVLMANGGPMV